jgi:3-deoxy-7-phosphoheptulonate synthase
MALAPRVEPPEEALRDRRIDWVRPVISPALLRQEVPLGEGAARVVSRSRAEVTDILEHRDDRLLVVVGPCSVHDPAAAMEYAASLRRAGGELRDALCVVMRVYFEKPRTTLGWKGLINDPRLDATFEVNEGLRTARRLLVDLLGLGLPVGCEFLDPIIPQYLADAVSWGAIGARTTESQVHRQLVSGLSMPVGVKNSTDGNVQVAVDAVRAAGARHVFTGVTDDGIAAIFATTGNPDAHVVLRGGSAGPNYDEDSVSDVLERLGSAGLPRRVVIDTSHGNSGKDHRRQSAIAREVALRRAAGDVGVVGVLLESFLVEGRQDLELGKAGMLTYGQSITDACMDWSSTERVLHELAGGVRKRRRFSPLTCDPGREERV